MSAIVEPYEIILEADGHSKPAPTDEDIAKALQGTRDDDWIVTLHRGDDDFMELMIDRRDLWVECEVDGKFLQARSYVDDEAAKSMLLAFRDGTEAWRDLAAWSEPPKPETKAPDSVVLAASGAVGLVVIGGLATALVTDNMGWIVLLFALLMPGLVALAAAVKVAQARRASAWTRASARIVRSELVVETRQGRKETVAHVEYEFPVGFHRFRGKRVSFAELMEGVLAKEAVARYRVGATTPIYFNPADPNESVIERDLPGFFRTLWIVVAALAAIILAGGLWLMLG